MRRRELFPPDRGLQARMVLAAVLTPLSVIGLTALVWWLLPAKYLLWIVAFMALGLFLTVRELRRAANVVLLAPDEEPELWAIVDRLCVAADLPRPEVVVDPDRQPNSWIVDLPGKPPRLHVTRGLLALLEPAELEAVVAHELAHVVHRDATVMTVVALPGDALEKGVTAPWATGIFGLGGLLAVGIGTVAGIGSAALSRHRELTADAGAAALTGRPSALSSALLKVSGALDKLPDEDLRVAAGWQTLNLVATEEGRLWWRTHPSVAQRVAALERMERRMATARPVAPRD